MADLPPYKRNSLCPKCGHGVSHIQFFKAGDTSPGWGDALEVERIAHKCNECSFVWNEAPIGHE